MYSAVVFFHLQPALLQFLEYLKLKPHQEFDLQPEGSETILCKEHLPPVCSRKPRNHEWEREEVHRLPRFRRCSLPPCNMWQHSQGRPGKWPKSKQSAQTLRSPLLSLTFLCLLPQALLSPQKRAGRLPSCSHHWPHQWTVKHAVNTFLPSTAQGPGMGRGRRWCLDFTSGSTGWVHSASFVET